MQRYGKRLSENFQVSSTVVLVASFTVKFLGTSVQRWMEATNWERHFRNGKKHNKTEGKEGWQSVRRLRQVFPQRRGALVSLSERCVALAVKGRGGEALSWDKQHARLDWWTQNHRIAQYSACPGPAVPPQQEHLASSSHNPPWTIPE